MIDCFLLVPLLVYVCDHPNHPRNDFFQWITWNDTSGSDTEIMHRKILQKEAKQQTLLRGGG